MSLTATDKTPGSGVREIRYRIDGGTTTAVPGTTAHFTISEEGIHEVRYQAVDIAGNVEPEQTLTVRVDKTAPEMEIGFDLTTKGFRIDSLDILSGPQTGSFSVTEAVYGKSTRSYQIKDNADNTLDLTVEIKQEGHEARLQVLELRYIGVAATLLDNKVKAEWHEKAGVLEELEQKLEVSTVSRSRRSTRQRTKKPRFTSRSIRRVRPNRSRPRAAGATTPTSRRASSASPA